MILRVSLIPSVMSFHWLSKASAPRRIWFRPVFVTLTAPDMPFMNLLVSTPNPRVAVENTFAMCRPPIYQYQLPRLF